MQNWIIRYVEDLKARIEPTGCSIHAALQVELPQMTRARLLKLREAADDLHRIIDLELGRRDDEQLEDVRENYPRESAQRVREIAAEIQHMEDRDGE